MPNIHSYKIYRRSTPLLNIPKGIPSELPSSYSAIEVTLGEPTQTYTYTNKCTAHWDLTLVKDEKDFHLRVSLEDSTTLSLEDFKAKSFLPSGSLRIDGSCMRPVITLELHLDEAFDYLYTISSDTVNFKPLTLRTIIRKPIGISLKSPCILINF